MKKRNSGFTLAELLIVVAIIAVLVAVAIPVFSNQLEKSREATDLANIRSAYAELSVQAISEEAPSPVTVALKQKEAGWTSASAEQSLKNISRDHVTGAPAGGGSDTALLEWDAANACVKITFNGAGSGSGSGGDGGGEGGGTVTYDSRKAFMKAAAEGLKKGFSELIPSEKIPQAKSCLHTDSYTAYNGDPVVVNELNISEGNLNAGVYWNPTKHTWGELLTEAGVDVGQLGGQNGYIYLDADLNPVSISYYDENDQYCYTFFDDGETVKTGTIPGERQHAAYYKEYAEAHGTIVEN